MGMNSRVSITFRRPAVLVVALCSISIAVPAEARNTKAWDDASNVGLGLLIAGSLGIPAAKGDWSGDLQALGSDVAAFGVAQGLKQAFPENRPDGSGNDSFPSGHASVSFAAAASLQNRYGWKVGLPAQALAAFVGLARVEARKHHWYDVVAGAAIGEASGFLLTSKHDSAVRVLPWGDAHGAGMIADIRF